MWIYVQIINIEELNRNVQGQWIDKFIYDLCSRYLAKKNCVIQNKIFKSINWRIKNYTSSREIGRLKQFGFDIFSIEYWI